MATKSTEPTQRVTIVVTGKALKAMLKECGERRTAGRHDWSIRQVIADALVTAYGGKK